MPINYNYQYGNNTFGNQYGLSPTQQAMANGFKNLGTQTGYNNAMGVQLNQPQQTYQGTTGGGNTMGMVSGIARGVGAFAQSMPGAGRNNPYMQNDPGNNFDTTNKAASAMSQMPGIPGLVGSIWSVGNKIGEADLNKSLQVDQDSGKLKDEGRLARTYVRGSFFDPAGSAIRGAQGGDSGLKVAAKALGFGAAFAKSDAKRGRRKAEALFNKQTADKIRTQRLEELSQQYQPTYGSSFACGGKMKMDGGIIGSYSNGGKMYGNGGPEGNGNFIPAKLSEEDKAKFLKQYPSVPEGSDKIVRYNNFNDQIEKLYAEKFKDYARIKREAPSDFSKRTAYADSVALANKDMYLSDEDIQGLIGEGNYNVYKNLRDVFPSYMSGSFNTEGTGPQSLNYGIRNALLRPSTYSTYKDPDKIIKFKYSMGPSDNVVKNIDSMMINPENDYLVNKYSNGQRANGGRVNPSTGLNGITKYKNGGTHESNPLGGVPLGKTGNSVEEGEVRWNDFIFTDRY